MRTFPSVMYEVGIPTTGSMVARGGATRTRAHGARLTGMALLLAGFVCAATGPAAAQPPRPDLTAAAFEPATDQPFVFSGPDGPRPAATRVAPDLQAGEAEDPSTFHLAIRWLWYAGLTGTVGAVAFRVLVLTGRLHLSRDVKRAASASAARLGAAAATLALLAAAGRLYANAVDAVGRLDAEALALIEASAAGGAWLIHAGASAAALAGFAIAMGGAFPGWILAVPATLVLAAAPVLDGHALTAGLGSSPIIAGTLHIIGGAGWLGGLVALLVAGIPAALRRGQDGGWIDAARLVRAFTPTALGLAILATATGLYAAWIYVGSSAALSRTSYGQILLVKIAALALITAVSSYDFLVAQPRLGDETGTTALRRTARAEITIGAAVLLFSALLTALPAPTQDLDATAAMTAPGAAAPATPAAPR